MRRISNQFRSAPIKTAKQAEPKMPSGQASSWAMLPRFFLMNSISSCASAIARYRLFQDCDLLAGIAALELARLGQANNAGADDEEVGVHVRWRTSD